MGERSRHTVGHVGAANADPPPTSAKIANHLTRPPHRVEPQPTHPNSNALILSSPHYAAADPPAPGVRRSMLAVPGGELQLGCKLSLPAYGISTADVPRGSDLMFQPDPMPVNQLATQRSPYLRQHAHQPVNWLPWGNEAFERAHREDKPVFLSVGYAACHWCHVMAHECFDNPQIAKLINRWFVPVKVDREERPDVDDVYMRYVVLLTGSGGWPLTVWLTPDRQPFFGGTYFPPEPRSGLPGLADLLGAIADLWQRDRARVIASAAEALLALRASPTAGGATPPTFPHWIEEAAAQAERELLEMADLRHGGLGGPPKFPQIPALQFLLARHEMTGAAAPREIARRAFDAIACGGIRDHLGGGVHRYAVDARWRIPHFEKMLCDQAMFIELCLEVHRITSEVHALDLASETVDFLLRELASPESAFWAALDADSPRPEQPTHLEEGAFYTWTSTEVRHILPDDLADLAAAAWGISEEFKTDFFHGPSETRYVPFMAAPVEQLARQFGIGPEEVRRRLAAARTHLFHARTKRPRPAVDDSIIASWNGIAISALARYARRTESPAAADAARRAARWILAQLWDPSDGRLHRCVQDDTRLVPGFGEDYAAVVRALLDLFELDFDTVWLREALAIQNAFDRHLWSPDNRLYRRSDANDGPPVDPDDADEHTLPSATALAAGNLLRLWLITDDRAWLDRLDELLAAIAPRVRAHPAAYPATLMAAMSRPLARRLVVSGAASAAETAALLKAARASAGPFVPVLMTPARGSHPLFDSASWTRFAAPGERAAVWVCDRGTCRPPIFDPAELVRSLNASCGRGPETAT